VPKIPAAGGEAQVTDVLFVIGGFNGLKSVQDWAKELEHNSHCYAATTYSWRQTDLARREIARLVTGKRVTLIGHSLGGGQAELLVQQLPAGTVDTLITVASFAPATVSHDLTRRNVGYWLNILSAPGKGSYQDKIRRLAAPILLNWQEQGFISSASENYVSEAPHHDFYKMMTDRCGAVEHGQFRSISA
jgi:pimeloyl-ACP methyl ester carboxylesterase